MKIEETLNNKEFMELNDAIESFGTFSYGETMEDLFSELDNSNGYRFFEREDCIGDMVPFFIASVGIDRDKYICVAELFADEEGIVETFGHESKSANELATWLYELSRAFSDEERFEMKENSKRR